MTDDETKPDPISRAFHDYSRPPHDIVPKTTAADTGSPPIPIGPEIGYYTNELGPDGVAREIGVAWVAAYRPPREKDNR